jgi:hypothetical protein
MRIPSPVTDLAPTASGRGYYMVTLTGAVYSFGDAQYYGNAPASGDSFTVGLSPTPGGYVFVDTKGRVTNRGGAHVPTSLGPSPTYFVGVAS